MSNMKDLLTICIYILILSGTALAQEEPVGSVSLGSDFLCASPAVSYGELRITVAGKGVYLEERYGPDEGTTLFFGQLADGLYKYEIIASPDMGQDDRAENPSLERDERARTHVQFGSFTVEGTVPELTVRPVKGKTPQSAGNEP